MRALVLVLLVACGDGAVKLSPVYELPALDDDALPSGLDTLVLSVARAGSDDDLASLTFAPGDDAELAEVPFDDELVVHLTGSVRGSQVAYGRTCAFAVSADDNPRPHLWFARNVKFASLQLEPSVHEGGTAIEHAGGVMLLGGDDQPIELFDARTGELATIGTVTARRGVSATRIGQGGNERIAIVGGDQGLLELVDATAGLARVDTIGDPRLMRSAATTSALTDGRVVLIGGRIGNAVTGGIIEMTNNETGTEIRELTATLAQPRADHTATRLGDDVGAPVLIVGGLGATGPVGIAELFKPLSRDLANPATFMPTMSFPRHRHRAELMPDGSVLVIGGLDGTGAPVLAIERFTIDAGFVVVANLPANAGVVDITTTRLPDGRILITGGRATATGAPVNLAMIARLDVVNGTVDVVGTDVLASARAGHVAVSLCDGTVWISGGTTTPPIAERYNPPPTGRR